MKRLAVSWIAELFCLLLCFGARADSPTDLATQIDAVIDAPTYKQARWGILVADSETGKTIYERNPDRMFLPASTTKLYSCAAALAALGPDYRFETPVYRRGTYKDGRLRGDLILVAQGDPTMGGRTGADGRLAFTNHDHTYAGFFSQAELTPTDPLAGLKSLARQVKESGIRQISGDVLIDDRLFDKARGSGSGPDLLTPIVINDNVVDVVVSPGEKVGSPAQVHMRPETPFVQMDALVVTVAEDQKPFVDLEPVGPNRFTLRGRIPLKSKRLVRIYPIADPAGFARALFIQALRDEGVLISASPLQPSQGELPQRDAYGQLTRVALFTSPPFSELIKVTLKVSHNLYASTLPLLAAVKTGKRTLADGLHAERRFLSDLGVDAETIAFAGGAGGAHADSVTPRATVQLLRALAKRPDYSAFEAGLPVLGEDGTLADAVADNSPARGKIKAKTGTLVWEDVLNDRNLLRSKALAGVMTTSKGRHLTFAMFVNDVPLPKGVPTSREGKVLGHLCEIIYLHCP